MDKKQYISYDTGLAKLQAYCVYQDRCHQEVRTKLLDLGMRGHDLELVITELIQDNFLNEERFARSYARGKFRMKQWGRHKISQELRRRKISAWCLKAALSEIDEEEYVETLQATLEKKNRVLRESNPYKRYKKLYEHGIRRGFESFLVVEYVKLILNITR